MRQHCHKGCSGPILRSIQARLVPAGAGAGAVRQGASRPASACLMPWWCAMPGFPTCICSPRPVRTLLRVQRFGRLGKRSWSDAVAPGKGGVPGDMASNSSMKVWRGVLLRPGWRQAAACAGLAVQANSLPVLLAVPQDPRYMYLSLDEACTHVDATAFRLVAGIYNRQGTRLLTTTVSPPIRVLANNDVPTGAARIPLEAQLPADWEGWIVEDAALAADAAGGEPLAASPRNGAAERRRKLQVGLTS